MALSTVPPWRGYAGPGPRPVRCRGRPPAGHGGDADAAGHREAAGGSPADCPEVARRGQLAVDDHDHVLGEASGDDQQTARSLRSARFGDVVAFRSVWTGEPHNVTLGTLVNQALDKKTPAAGRPKLPTWTLGQAFLPPSRMMLPQ